MHTFQYTAQLFRRAHPMLEGYALAIRDSWTYHVKRINVTEEQKELYLKKFGEVVVFDYEFYAWFKQIIEEKLQKQAQERKEEVLQLKELADRMAHELAEAKQRKQETATIFDA